jgi:hypothetical protein
VRKTLELDRRKCGLNHEKGETEKREEKREFSHGPFLLLSLLAVGSGRTKPVRSAAP